MSEAGTGGATPRLDDVERALVLAREVAAATAGGGGANIRTAHLRQLFGNGGPAPSPARMQAALEAAGLRADPPLTEDPESVSLHVEGDRATLASESPTRRRPGPSRHREDQPSPRRPRPNIDFDEEPEETSRPRYQSRTRPARRSAERAPEPAVSFEDDDPNDPDYDLPISPRFGAAAYEAAATPKAPEPEPEPEPDPDPEPELVEFADEDEAYEDDFVDEPAHEDDDEPEPEPAAAAAPERTDPDAPLTLADMERLVARRPDKRTVDEVSPALLAALMPALILPVLIAAFVGPLFGAIFAGLCILSAGLLSRPYALADGKLGPVHLPRSLGRSFLVIAILTAVIALSLSVALIVAGGTDTEPLDESEPIETTEQTETTTPNRTPPAPPANETTGQNENSP